MLFRRPQNARSGGRVNEVRSILRAIDWCEINLVKRSSNLGLDRSVMTGVTAVFQTHDTIIVFEDDLVCVPGPISICALRWSTLRMIRM